MEFLVFELPKNKINKWSSRIKSAAAAAGGYDVGATIFVRRKPFQAPCLCLRLCLCVFDKNVFGQLNKLVKMNGSTYICALKIVYIQLVRVAGGVVDLSTECQYSDNNKNGQNKNYQNISKDNKHKSLYLGKSQTLNRETRTRNRIRKRRIERTKRNIFDCMNFYFRNSIGSKVYWKYKKAFGFLAFMVWRNSINI